ncbi:MAG: hypothetical protein ACI4VQ_01640 [Clostridia bacterium]
MKLTKNIIDEMVSYIDFADIRTFVQNHPELVRIEELIQKKIFTNFIIVDNISKVYNLCNMKIIKVVRK